MNDDDDRKVFIGYFHYSIPSNTLREIFAKFGQIKSFWKSPSVPKTFAFVVYRTTEDAQNAVRQLNGIFIDKDRVKVNLARDKDQEFLANISAESCSEDECCLNKENGHKHKKDSNNEMINQQLNQTKFKNSLKRSKSTTNLPGENSSDDKQSSSYDDTNNGGKGRKSKFRYFNQKINPELESYSTKPAKQSKNDSNTLNKLNKQIDQQNSNRLNRKLNNQQNEFANQFINLVNNQFNNQFDNPFTRQYNNQNSNQFNYYSKNFNRSNLNSNQYYNPFHFSSVSTSSKPNTTAQKQRKKSNSLNESTLTIDLTVPSPLRKINPNTGEIDIEDTLDNNELDTSIKKFEVITIDDD